MYCNIAWGHAFRCHIRKLQVLQKKVIRFITNSYLSSPSTPLFLQLNILPFNELVALNCLIFVFKIQLTPQASLLKDLFVANSGYHQYNTRQRDLVHQPYVRTHTALNSFFIACIKEWNIVSCPLI